MSHRSIVRYCVCGPTAENCPKGERDYTQIVRQFAIAALLHSFSTPLNGPAICVYMCTVLWRLFVASSATLNHPVTYMGSKSYRLAYHQKELDFILPQLRLIVKWMLNAAGNDYCLLLAFNDWALAQHIHVSKRTLQECITASLYISMFVDNV